MQTYHVIPNFALIKSKGSNFKFISNTGGMFRTLVLFNVFKNNLIREGRLLKK